MIEIQDRDFVLALGISCDDDGWTFTYALPDLGLVDSSAGEEPRLIRTYSGTSFPEIEDRYNRNSSRRLDYRHLQVLVLDPAVATDEEKLASFLNYINENNEISRNVLVYYYDGDVEELFAYDEKLNGSIGDYIQSIETNNSDRFELAPITTGDFIDGLYSQRTLLVPRLALEDDSIFLDGAAVFSHNQRKESVSQEQYLLWHLINGEGNDFIMTLPDGESVKLYDMKSSFTYRYRDDVPVITIKVTGTAELLSEQTENLSDNYVGRSLNQYIKTSCEEDLRYFMEELETDYLNLYEKSSRYSRDIWLAYENNLPAFIRDADIGLQINFQLQ